MAEIDYEIWCLCHDTGEAELETMRGQVGDLARRPRISLILPVGELDELWLRDGIESVRRQVYPDWELFLCQRGDRARVADLLPAAPGRGDQVKAAPAPEGGHGSTGEALSAALAAADGEYVVVLGEGAELAPDALFRVVEQIQEADADILYTDEDSVDRLGRRSSPVFKPRWSPDLLLSSPYTGGLCLIRRALLEDVGGVSERFGEAAEHEAILRVAEQASTVVHVPGVLYHRRAALDVPASEAAGEARVAAIDETLRRRGERGRVRLLPDRGSVRILRELESANRVSIIVRLGRRGGNAPLLRQLQQRAGAYEVIAANSEPAPKGSGATEADRSPVKAANEAAARATGDVLVFLDGHGSMPGSSGPGWLVELAAQAGRRGVGAVSGRLMNPDGTVRHGGTAVDIEGLLEPRRDRYEPDDHDLLMVREVLNPGGATEDLLAVDASLFRDVGGFDEERLASRFFGLDLAFRLEERGLRSVYTPYSVLVSRELRPEPTRAEIGYMWRRWSTRLTRLMADRWPPTDWRHRPAAVAAGSPHSSAQPAGVSP